MRTSLLLVLLTAGCASEPRIDCDFDSVPIETIATDLREKAGLNIILNDRIASVELPKTYCVHARQWTVREILDSLGMKLYLRDDVLIIEE